MKSRTVLKSNFIIALKQDVNTCDYTMEEICHGYHISLKQFKNIIFGDTYKNAGGKVYDVILKFFMDYKRLPTKDEYNEENRKGKKYYERSQFVFHYLGNKCSMGCDSPQQPLELFIYDVDKLTQFFEEGKRINPSKIFKLKEKYWDALKCNIEQSCCLLCQNCIVHEKKIDTIKSNLNMFVNKDIKAKLIHVVSNKQGSLIEIINKTVEKENESYISLKVKEMKQLHEREIAEYEKDLRYKLKNGKLSIKESLDLL